MMLREPWRTRLLFVSFAINLILIPMVGAQYMHVHRHRQPGPPRTEIMLDHMAHELPDSDAERFRAAMASHVGDIDAARAQMLAARAATSEAIGRSPFDDEAVRAAMQAWQQAWNRWSAALGSAMLDALPALSDQGRRQLADSGRRPPSR